MSEMTRCNFCRLQSIQKEADEKGLKVTIIHGDVYMHPKDFEAGKLNPDSKFWQAWFMELSTHCVC